MLSLGLKKTSQQSDYLALESSEKFTTKNLRVKLCEWEKVFEQVHGRKPKKIDVTVAPPNVKELYKQYGELKKRKGTKEAARQPAEKPIYSGSTLPVFKMDKPVEKVDSPIIQLIPTRAALESVEVAVYRIPPRSAPVPGNFSDCIETLFGVTPNVFNCATGATITDFDLESVKNLCPMFHKPQCRFPGLTRSTSNEVEMTGQEEQAENYQPFEDELNSRKRKNEELPDDDEAKKPKVDEEEQTETAKKPFKPAKRAVRRNLAGFKLQLNKKRYVAVGAKQLRNAKFSSKRKFSNWKGRKNFGR